MIAMKTEQSLYIRILIWAYNRQESGFTWGDLQNEFSLNPRQLEWVQKVFRSNMPQSDNLIDHLSYNDEKDSHQFVITAKGTSAAIEYLSLREAKKSGRRAEKVAIVAIAIGVIVGIAQVIIQIYFR